MQTNTLTVRGATSSTSTSSGGVGGSVSGISSNYISPYDFAAVYQSASEIALTGLPFTPTVQQIAYIIRLDTVSKQTTTYINGVDGYYFAFDSGTGYLTVYKGGVLVASFLSSDVFEVGIEGQEKAYDAATLSMKVSLIATQLSKLEKVGVTLHPTHFSPQHFSVAFTTTSTITCTPFAGLPAIDGANMNIVSVFVMQTGNVNALYINGKDGINIVASANVISIYKNGVLQTPFADTDSKYRVSVNYMDIGDDPSTDTKKVTVENYPVQPVPTGIAFSTDSTTSYFSSSDGIDMSNYQGLTVQVASNAGVNAGSTTITVEATNVETPDTTDDWTDITKMGVNMNTNTSGAASVTVTGASSTALLLFVNLNVKAVRVKYANTGFTGSLNLRRL